MRIMLDLQGRLYMVHSTSLVDVRRAGLPLGLSSPSSALRRRSASCGSSGLLSTLEGALSALVTPLPSTLPWVPPSVRSIALPPKRVLLEDPVVCKLVEGLAALFGERVLSRLHTSMCLPAQPPASGHAAFLLRRDQDASMSHQEPLRLGFKFRAGHASEI